MTIRIVSIGDSFTEGLGDEWPDGQERGWADRVAVGLAAEYPDQEVWYANLAIRGRLLAPIVTEQLDAALALDPPPTHLTFCGGGNDMLRPGYSAQRMRTLASRVIDLCEAAGVQVIVLSGPNPSDLLPAARRIRSLGNSLTDIAESLAQDRQDVTFVDNFRDPEITRAPYWSADRLHLASLGHELVASRVLGAIGVATQPPVLTDADAPRGGIVGQARYWRAYVLPWMWRRLRGRSSGDGREPKYPTWVRVGPERPWSPELSGT